MTNFNTKIKISDIQSIPIGKSISCYTDSVKAVNSIKSLISQYRDKVGIVSVKTEKVPGIDNEMWRVEIKKIS